VGQPLFEREGKRLLLTPVGATALDYANAIFAMGDELTAVLRGGSRPKSTALRVGVTDSVPKLLTVAIMEPLLEKHRTELELTCDEGAYAALLGRLAGAELDMVLADAAVPANLSRTLQATLLAESGISFVAAPTLATRLKGKFPQCLDGAPLLAGSVAHSLLGQSLESWYARHNVRPHIVGRIDDSALLKGFAHSGLGIATVPTSIEDEVVKQYRVKVVGRTNEVVQSVFLIRSRGRKPHPLVAELESRKSAR
jgi:LysR family transcriptional activator of nhaA